MVRSHSIRIRRSDRPTRWLRRPRWQVQELDAIGNVRFDEVTAQISRFLIDRNGVHTTDYWDWIKAADEAFARGDDRWVENPFLRPEAP